MRTNRAQKSSDYKLFEMAPENRPLHDDPVLTASMQKFGFFSWCPVIVKRNGHKLRIVVGHHRFAAAERLGIALWYLVVDGEIPDIFFLEGTRAKWSPEDFGRARASDNPAIAKVFAFAKKHGLTFATAASLLGGEGAGSGNHMKYIKEGRFVIAEDQSHSKAVVEITDFARDQGIPFAGSKSFASAVSMALHVEGFDPATFLHRLKVRPAQMIKRSSAHDYLTEMEALYNFGSHNLFPLKVEAVKESRARRIANLHPDAA
jgi:ParB-like nuclease domain